MCCADGNARAARLRSPTTVNLLPLFLFSPQCHGSASSRPTQDLSFPFRSRNTDLRSQKCPIIHHRLYRHIRKTHRGARRRATSTQDTLVHAIQFLPVLLRLQVFALFRYVVILQERLDRLVLLVKVGQVGHEVFDNVHCRSVFCLHSHFTIRSVCLDAFKNKILKACR